MRQMEAANAELARANRQLRGDNESLQSQLRRYRQLLEMTSHVRPDVDLARALEYPRALA